MQEKIFVKNKKGLKLAAIIEKPKDRGKFPNVILFHGFKGYKEEAQYSELAKELLKRNIASVRFDASGFGESEGVFEKDYRLTNYINDASCVYESLLRKDWVDKKRIGVMGQSLGGAMALIISSKYPEIKAVVSVSTPDIFATRDELGKRIKEWMKKGFIELESSKENGAIRVPFAYALDAMKYDIKKYAKRVKCPKLFMLGLSDVTVIPAQTRVVFDFASKPKKLEEYKGMRHDYKNQPKILRKANNDIVNFFTKNL